MDNEALKLSQWVSVEKQPILNKRVLLCTSDGNKVVGRACACYGGGLAYVVGCGETVEATHWMPRPDAPEVGK